MEDYKKTHEWWVNVPRQVAPKHQQSLSVPAMTASTNLTPKVVVEQNKHEKTSYISGIMIKKAMKVVSFPKAWLKTKNRQLSLSCAWDGHCLPSVSPRLSETYCFRKNRGFNAKGEPSEKNYKSNWCCAVERLEGFINMSTGMICIYFYVFAAKIGWAYGCWPKETKHHQGWSRRKQRAESQCTCFQMIGSCLFLPRSLGRWSNLTKATAVFNCIETTYINVWIHGIPLQHLPFQFRLPVASEQFFKRIPFRLPVLLISTEFLWYGYYLLTFLLKGHVKKHRVSRDCGETTQESPLLRFGELRGLLRTMTGTLSTLDISNLGSSDERIAARRTRAEAKLKQDKERGLWSFFLLLLHGKLIFEERDTIDIFIIYNIYIYIDSDVCVCQFSIGPLECSDW